MFYRSDSLVEDGGLEILALDEARDLLQPCPSPGIIMRPFGVGTRRKAHQDVMYTLLVRDCKAGALSQLGQLARPYPTNGKTSKLLGRIAGACAYDKVVRKRY